MSDSINGGMGAYMERSGFIGSRDAIVQDPEERRDAMLYGQFIVNDGAPVAVFSAPTEYASDVAVTGTWQRVFGCIGTVPVPMAADQVVAIVDVHIKNTGGVNGALQFGLSDDDLAPPAAAFNSNLTTIPDGTDGMSPTSGTYAAEVIANSTLYLWVRSTAGTGLTVSGTTQASRMMLASPLVSHELPGDLSTNGHSLVGTLADGSSHFIVRVADGTGLLPSGTPAFAATKDGTYDGVAGAITLPDGGTDIYGQTMRVLSSAVTLEGLIKPAGGGILLVDQQGNVYVREESTSISENDTSVSTQAVLLTHELITGLGMTLANTYTAGKARFYASISFTNLDTRAGNFFIAPVINTVEGDAQSFPVDALGSGSLTVDLPISGTLTAGDVIEVNCWRTDDQQTMTLNLNGAVNTHTIVVYEQAGGGGTGEANTLADVGGGAGFSAGKVGTALQMKSLVSGDATVNITSTGTEVDIRAVTGGGGAPLPIDFISGFNTSVDSTNVHSGTGTASLPGGTTLTVSSDLTVSATGLTASTLYHLYLYDSGGGVGAIELSTVVPVAYQGSARQKTGDATRRWIDSVTVDSTGAGLPQLRNGPDVKFLVEYYRTDLRLVGAGLETTPTALDTTDMVPRDVSLMLHVNNTTADQRLDVYMDSSTEAFAIQHSTATVVFGISEVGDGLHYAFANTVSIGGAFIDILGWSSAR